MSIIHKVQNFYQTNQPKPENNKTQRMTIVQQYFETKKTLSKDIISDIEMFKKKYPNLKEHIIYMNMRKHDMKKDLVETELKYESSLQGEIVQDSSQTKSKNKRRNNKKKSVQQEGDEDTPKREETEQTKNSQTNVQKNFQNKEKNFNNKKERQNYQNKGTYNDNRTYPRKNDQNYRQNQKQNRRNNQIFEYVQKDKEERPIPVYSKHAESSGDKPLSNINEESDDHSQKRVPDESPLVKINRQPQEFNDPQISEPADVEIPSLITEGCSKATGNKESHASSAYKEHTLMNEGLNHLNQVFMKHQSKNFYTWLASCETLETRKQKNGAKVSEKRVFYTDPKKKKPLIKNNFETEENEESNNERNLKMNHFHAIKKFESEEERLKGKREIALERKMDDLLSQMSFLMNKVSVLEHEVSRVNSVNHDLNERNKLLSRSNEDSIFVLMPFSQVKDTFPFNQVAAEDLKAGSFLMFRNLQEN